MNSFAIRSALVVIAVLAGVWLALGVRAVALEDDADAVLARARAGPVPQTQVNVALDDLAKAGRLSPDQGPLIEQGELLWAAGRKDEARTIAARATGAEPDNLQAWYLNWGVAEPNSAARDYAEKRVLALNPWFAYALRRAQGSTR